MNTNIFDRAHPIVVHKSAIRIGLRLYTSHANGTPTTIDQAPVKGSHFSDLRIEQSKYSPLGISYTSVGRPSTIYIQDKEHEEHVTHGTTRGTVELL